MIRGERERGRGRGRGRGGEGERERGRGRGREGGRGRERERGREGGRDDHYIPPELDFLRQSVIIVGSDCIELARDVEDCSKEELN